MYMSINNNEVLYVISLSIKISPSVTCNILFNVILSTSISMLQKCNHAKRPRRKRDTFLWESLQENQVPCGSIFVIYCNLDDIKMVLYRLARCESSTKDFAHLKPNIFP